MAVHRPRGARGAVRSGEGSAGNRRAVLLQRSGASGAGAGATGCRTIVARGSLWRAKTSSEECGHERPRGHFQADGEKWLKGARTSAHPYQREKETLDKCLTELRGGEAREKEAEKGVRIGVDTDLGIGRTGIGARETFVVYADVHGLDGAERGIDEEGDGHGIEKSGRLLAPLVVKEGEGVGERRALAEEVGALDFVELELGGVEGHDEERHAGGKQFLGGRNVVQDVPFGLRRCRRAKTEVAATALDGAAHQDDALEFAERSGVFVDGGADVHQWADGYEGNLAGATADLVEEEGIGIRVGRFGEVVVLGVAALGESSFGWRGDAGGHRDFRAADFGKEAVEELGAGLGVTERGGDAEDLEFGAAESEGDGEGVVDIVADVGVEDYFFRGGVGGGGLGAADGSSERH